MAKVSVGALLRSAGYAGFASLWQILSRLILTPLVLARIGLEGYGIWTLLFSLADPVSMVGASFGLSYAKLTAEHDGRRDYAGLSEVLGSGMALIGGSAALALGILWLARDPILAALGVPGGMLDDAGSALLLVVVTAALQMSVGCVTQVVAGLQRTDLRYKSIVLSSVLYFAGALVLLERGWGLLGLGIAYVGGEAAAIGFCWLACRRLCPELRLSPLCASRSGARQVLSLGGRFQALYFLSMGSSAAFRMLLSALLGPAMLGTYQLALRLIQFADAMAGAVLAPMMPAFARLHADHEREAAWTLYRLGSRLVFVVGLLGFGFLAVFADPILWAWTDQQHPLAAWSIRVMAVAFVAKHLTGMGTASLRGQGNVALELQYGLIVALSTWVLVPLLYWSSGYRGMIVAISFGLAFGSCWFLWAFARREGFPLAPYLNEAVLRSLVVLMPVLMATAGLAGRLDLPVPLPAGRWHELAEVAVWAFVLGMAAFLTSWSMILSPTDRVAVREVVSGWWGRRAMPFIAIPPKDNQRRGS